MRLLAGALALVAGPCMAQGVEPLDWLGALGCTYGDGLRADAQAAGVALVELDAAIRHGLAGGTAVQQGPWVVFAEEVCTIRLPDVQSDARLTDADIAASIRMIEEADDLGGSGCFLWAPSEVFARRTGGDLDAATAAYIEFVAASIITGDVRFYSENMLMTPPGFQVTTGDCATAPNIAAVRANHRYITEAFGTYVRRTGAGNVCSEPPSALRAAYSAEIQGYDVEAEPAGQDAINAFLFLEYDVITMAAGWYEGMSGTERGQPRPPLCHYPQ